MILVSICVPSFNRADLVCRFVASLQDLPGPFEICVHDDGSSDDTFDRLAEISEPRLRVSRAENAGRAQALSRAVEMARGRFVMLFDDDDRLYPAGLQQVLADCAQPLPDGCAGYIYQLEDDGGQQIGRAFPVARSNLIALRADHHITGDKKEVVLRSLLAPAMAVPGRHRRVPTSLYWARISRTHDILCRNLVIGRKTYLAGGMSDTIRRLKAENLGPMILLHRERLDAFRNRRYRSLGFAARSLGALLLHTAHAFVR